MGSLLGIAVEAYVSSGTTRPIFKLDLVCTYFKLGGDLNTMTYNDDDVDVWCVIFYHSRRHRSLLVLKRIKK